MNKKVTLKTWWKNNYDEPYCPRSVQRLARLGRILPRPSIENGRYMVLKSAKYIEIDTKKETVKLAVNANNVNIINLMSQF
jgi:hypothetical protein